MASRIEVAQSLAILSSAYQVEMDEPLLESYAIALTEVPARYLKEAVALTLKQDSSFLPRPGELLTTCRYQAQADLRAAVKAWNDFNLFGRGNALTSELIKRFCLTGKLFSAEFFVTGRRRFVRDYAKAIGATGGNESTAIASAEHSQKLIEGDQRNGE